MAVYRTGRLRYWSVLEHQMRLSFGTRVQLNGAREPYMIHGTRALAGGYGAGVACIFVFAAGEV